MAAPLGNKFAVGNNGGRPPVYDDPAKLQEECDAYFDYIKGESHVEEITTTNKDGIALTEKILVWDRKPEPAAITALALYLGFANRKALSDYEDKEEFSNVIKRAKARVEMHYEHSLNYQTCTGAIFALKNMGWKDKQEHEVNANVANLNEAIKFE